MKGAATRYCKFSLLVCLKSQLDKVGLKLPVAATLSQPSCRELRMKVGESVGLAVPCPAGCEMNFRIDVRHRLGGYRACAAHVFPCLFFAAISGGSGL
jgi:hypothetical protein